MFGVFKTMIYRVRLHREKMYPCEIGGICADNEEEAVIKAKKAIAHNGYWENNRMSIEDRISKLTVESVTADNI